MNNRSRFAKLEWQLQRRKVIVVARDRLGNAISPARQTKKALLAECGSARQLRKRLQRERREAALGE